MPFEIVISPQFKKPTRMSPQSQLLLGALEALKPTQSIRFESKNSEEAFRRSKVLMRFVADVFKTGKINKKFSVHRRLEESDGKEVWGVYVTVRPLQEEASKVTAKKNATSKRGQKPKESQRNTV